MQRKDNLTVFRLLRYCIGLLSVALLLITLLRIFDIIYYKTTLTWVYIGLVPIVVLMFAGQFFLEKLKSWHIHVMLAVYVAFIVFMMFSLSGYITERTYVIKHDADPALAEELQTLFQPLLPGSSAGQENEINTSSTVETRIIRRGVYYVSHEFSETLDVIDKSTPVEFPQAELVIEHDKYPQMNSYSNLHQGDRISVKINWTERKLKRIDTSSFFHSGSLCVIYLPLEIENQSIYVDLYKDEKLTLNKLTVFMDKFPPEQEKEARKSMMVSHVLKFNPDIDDEFFKALRYEGRGELMLPIVNLRIPHISLDYCSNSNFMLASILEYKPNPYTVQLLFPALVKNMKSWYYEDKEVFVGFGEMLSKFNRDYQKFVKRLF